MTSAEPGSCGITALTQSNGHSQPCANPFCGTAVEIKSSRGKHGAVLLRPLPAEWLCPATGQRPARSASANNRLNSFRRLGRKPSKPDPPERYFDLLNPVLRNFRHSCRQSNYVPLLGFLQNSVAVFGMPLALIVAGRNETAHGNFQLSNQSS